MHDPIRVGIINADTHGMWFGALMDEVDPLLLQRPTASDDPTRYSWQTGLVHYYYFSNYRDPMKMTARSVPGFAITKIWDEDRASAQMFSRVFYGRPQVCDTFEQVSDDVELVLIASCNSDGTHHLSLARPGIEKGVATFVDKPLAFTVADAMAILALGKQHQTAVMSMSILQTDPQTCCFANRLPEVGRVLTGTIQSPTLHIAGLVHSISVVHRVFGGGIQQVSTLRVAEKQTIIHMDYGDREDRPSEGVLIHSASTDHPYDNFTRFSRSYAAAYGSEGAISGMVLDGFSAVEGASRILERVCQMVRTGQPQSGTDDMIRTIAVAEAVRKSLDRQVSVAVTPVFEEESTVVSQ